jgi:hypothetical protein
VAERKEPSQLVGDALRDIAILTFVFCPLDVLVDSQFHGGTPDWSIILLVEVGAVIVFGIGVIFEGRDEL